MGCDSPWNDFEIKRKSCVRFLSDIVKTQLYIINVESEQVSFQKKQAFGKNSNTSVEDPCVVEPNWVDSRSRFRELKAYSLFKEIIFAFSISSRGLKFILSFRWIVAGYLVSSKCFELFNAVAPSRSVLLRLRVNQQALSSVITIFARTM